MPIGNVRVRLDALGPRARDACPVEEGGVIDTPCWVKGAETVHELTLVHAWNEMVQMQKDAATDDPTTATDVGTHLTVLCLGLRPK